MRTSTVFVIAGAAIVFLYAVDAAFFNIGVELLALAGSVVFLLLVLWILHGAVTERGSRRLHRFEEFVTHPCLIVLLFMFGAVLLIASVYYLFAKSVGMPEFLLMIEIGALSIILAYNNGKEGRKRGHW